jgi:hypothetical protein
VIALIVFRDGSQSEEAVVDQGSSHTPEQEEEPGVGGGVAGGDAAGPTLHALIVPENLVEAVTEILKGLPGNGDKMRWGTKCVTTSRHQLDCDNY